MNRDQEDTSESWQITLLFSVCAAKVSLANHAGEGHLLTEPPTPHSADLRWGRRPRCPGRYVHPALRNPSPS